jgi:hypothetical protein
MKTHGVITMAAAMLLVSAAAYGQERHPHYLTARTDLRTAQMLARVQEQPNVHLNLQAADREMDAAVKEIDSAAVIDRKDLVDHPPIDANLARVDRFRKMVELLRTARADIEHEEDNPRAREWRNAATQHIDEALKALRRAATDAKLDREIGDF